MHKKPIYTEDGHDLHQPADEFSDLRFAEQLTVWSLRFWADCHKRDQSPYEPLKQAYILAKSKDAMAAFDGFMSVLVVGLYRQMDVPCMKCGGISMDEKIILSALSAEQCGDSRESQNLLGRLLSPSALRIGHNMLSAWASNLAAAGHRIPDRNWDILEDDYQEIFENPAYYSPAILH